MAAAAETDPYTVLGVARSATQAEIKTAYQTLMGRYHPDLHQGNPLADLATERVVEINRAYALLSAPAQRAAYDAGPSGRPPAGAPSRGEASMSIKPVVTAVVLIVALPLVLRAAVAAIRGVGGALGGGQIAALVVVVAVVVVLATLRRKRRR